MDVTKRKFVYDVSGVNFVSFEDPDESLENADTIGEDDLIRPEWQERTHNLEEFVEDDQDKNPQCDICGKFHNTRKQLYNQKQTHKNENSNCDNCDKYFSTKIKLLTHKKTVHNNQKNLCEKCNMTFTAKKNVKAHEVSHHEREKICI